MASRRRLSIDSAASAASALGAGPSAWWPRTPRAKGELEGGAAPCQSCPCVASKGGAASPEGAAELEPFAHLSVKVVRARGVAGPGVGGLADPYVVLQVDGEQRRATETDHRTLAPKWEEQFDNIEIPGPSSVLSLLVYDRSLLKKSAQFMQDELLGHVDVHLLLLPPGRRVQGWFGLQSGRAYHDHVSERQRRWDELGGAGQIWLELEVQPVPTADFVAAHMRQPEPEKVLPRLDLPRLYDLVQGIVRRFNSQKLAVKHRIIRVKPFLWASAAVLVWHPACILPCVLVVAALGLVSRLSSQQGSGWILVPPPAEPSAEEQERDRRMRKQLRRLQAVLPEGPTRFCRNVHKAVELLTHGLEHLDGQREVLRVRTAKAAVPLLLGAACLALCLHAWQAWVLQAGFAVLFAALAVRASWLGRLLRAWHALQRRRRLRIALPETPTGGRGPAGSDCTDSSASPLDTLQEPHTRLLANPSAKALAPPGSAQSQRHHFRPRFYPTMRQCNDCGELFWGTWGQGYRCEFCCLDLCRQCIIHTQHLESQVCSRTFPEGKTRTNNRNWLRQGHSRSWASPLCFQCVSGVLRCFCGLAVTVCKGATGTAWWVRQRHSWRRPILGRQPALPDADGGGGAEAPPAPR